MAQQWALQYFLIPLRVDHQADESSGIVTVTFRQAAPISSNQKGSSPQFYSVHGLEKKCLIPPIRRPTESGPLSQSHLLSRQNPVRVVHFHETFTQDWVQIKT